MNSKGVWRRYQAAAFPLDLPLPESTERGDEREWRFFISTYTYIAKGSGDQAVRFRHTIQERAPSELLKRIEQALLNHLAAGKMNECTVALSDVERGLLVELTWQAVEAGGAVERASAASPARLMIQEGVK